MWNVNTAALSSTTPIGFSCGLLVRAPRDSKTTSGKDASATALVFFELFICSKHTSCLQQVAPVAKAPPFHLLVTSARIPTESSPSFDNASSPLLGRGQKCLAQDIDGVVVDGGATDSPCLLVLLGQALSWSARFGIGGAAWLLGCRSLCSCRSNCFRLLYL